MFYEEMPEIDRDEATEIFKTGTSDEIITTLIRVAFYDPDWQWVEKVCLDFLTSDDLDIRKVAVICLGHIARIHQIISYDVVIPILTDLLDDDKLSGNASDALDDIEIFTKQ